MITGIPSECQTVLLFLGQTVCKLSTKDTTYKKSTILLKTRFASVINICMYFIDGKIETNKHLEQPFYLLTQTWKYGGGDFGTEVAG